MNHASIALVVVGRCFFASARVMLLIGQHPILQYFVADNIWNKFYMQRSFFPDQIDSQCLQEK